MKTSISGIVLLSLQATLTTSFTPTRQNGVVAPSSAVVSILSTSSGSGSSSSSTRLHSLKPAATPLLDSGKALARSGELLIDATATPTLDSYGGGLSQAGANIRNAGDCVAQAAASCRFKTAAELVCDEIREAATCLTEAVDHLKKGADDANVDDNTDLSQQITACIDPMGYSGKSLERAGAGIMTRETSDQIGENMYQCGVQLEQLATNIQLISPGLEETKNSSLRLMYAAEKMREAGNNLKGIEKPKKKGKGWLKG